MSAIEHLKWALQALAQPSDTQIELFPAFVCVPDELVLDYDEWFRKVRNEHDLTPEQLNSLRKLDAAIEKESGPSHAELWTEAALHTDPRWERFRELARNALAAFDWPMSVPRRDRAFYLHKNDA